jgi:carboxyl-terminal processing protease
MAFGRKITTLLLALLLAVPSTLASSPDVPADLPEATAIQALQDAGVGKEGQNFYPRRPVTLAEFVTFGVLASKAPKELLKSTQTRFTDVAPEAWYTPYIALAERHGVLGEYGDTLRPSRPVTRAMAAKIGLGLYGYGAPLTVTAEEFGFTDLPATHPLAPFAYQALKIGVLEPATDELFGTNTRLSRAEAAQFFANLNEAGPAAGAAPQIIIQSGSLVQIPNAEILNAVWNEIEHNFLFEDQIDQQAMIDGALKGLVESLGDPYSTFLPNESTSAFTQDLEGQFEGIGAHVARDEITGEISIVAPLRGSPAEKAGIQPGDAIITVDGTPVTGLSLGEAVNLIKGPKGTMVNLGLRRNGNLLEVRVMRAKIEIHSVEVSYENNIAIITLSQFGSTTPAEFAAVVEEINTKKPKGVILDLRNNPGGLLTVAVEVLSYFLPDESVALKARFRDSNRDVIYRTSGTPALAAYPLVTLVNHGSASASEIVAGALADYGIGTIMGETTYGKGTVQELSFFQNGTALKLTIAHWLSPKEKPINKVGIKPSIEATDNPTTSTDEVLQQALSMF